MARARNIKPGFFTSDQLAECEPLARILFAGLWCESDRAGRLEDRPKKLKASCLPHDDCDVDGLLGQLADHGLIYRYVVDGVRYIAVLEFAKHQNPHVREPASSIPAPDKHSAKPVQGDVSHESGPADSPSLIPEELPTTSGAEAPVGDQPELQIDPSPAEAAKAADPIWHTGLAFLVRKGIPQKQAREFLGKLKREAGDIDAAALLAQAEDEDITEPIPWLSKGAANARDRRNGGRNGSYRETPAERVARKNREAGFGDPLDGECRRV